MSLGGLRLVLTVEKSADGLHFGEIISVDQGDSRIPVERITVIGDSVHLDLRAATANFHGRLGPDGNRLRGTWNQRIAIPLEFRRVEAVPAPLAEAGADFWPLELSLALSTSVAPTPFSSDEKSHLAYELHLGNLSLAEMPVTRIEVLDGDRVIAAFDGVELSAIMSATSASGLDHRTIAPAARATVFLWLSFGSDAQVPTRLEHRVTVRDHTANGGITRVGPKPSSSVHHCVVETGRHWTGLTTREAIDARLSRSTVVRPSPNGSRRIGRRLGRMARFPTVISATTSPSSRTVLRRSLSPMARSPQSRTGCRTALRALTRVGCRWLWKHWVGTT